MFDKNILLPLESLFFQITFILRLRERESQICCRCQNVIYIRNKSKPRVNPVPNIQIFFINAAPPYILKLYNNYIPLHRRYRCKYLNYIEIVCNGRSYRAFPYIAHLLFQITHILCVECGCCTLHNIVLNEGCVYVLCCCL